mmetsp:Transcript_4331/g.13070  ORF Transcript_4331/g.13070 Transcript_4331/m.13070 type:complete len:943 (+) Transcript_4331:311-3139(+)
MRSIVALAALCLRARPTRAAKARRAPRCADADVVARCLARCELFGAELKLRAARRFDGVIANRCLEECEEDFCPRRPPPGTEWVVPDATKKTVDPSATTFKRRPVGDGRALVAVPQPEAKVFLSWRMLAVDGAGHGAGAKGDRVERVDDRAPPNYSVQRRVAGGEWEGITTSSRTSLIDTPPGKKGTVYEYRVKATSGDRRDVWSRVASVKTESTGKDYVELSPPDQKTGANKRASMPPISNVLLADTDGDGELEGVAWRKVGSDADGTKRYVISIIEFDGSGITRDYDTDMGRPPPAKPPKGDWVTVESKGKRSVLKEAPGSESSLWTRPRAAGDVDGDGREEIWTVGHVDGACVYLLLRDDGVNVSLVASTPSPYPICDGADNSRHDAFLANLDGDPNKLSLGMAGGRHEPWRIFVWDLIDGTTLVPRWDSGSGVATRRDGKVATANAQNSHNVAVVDVDCDGRDEIIAGGTVVDDDGSILWGTNHWFGASAHVDGIVVDDIDPDSPGFEILLFSETGPEWGLYRAADGAPRVEAVAAEFHLQWNLAVNVSESRGLDVVGTFGGHLVDGGFSYGGGAFKPYPFGKWPREALNWFPIDWDGRGGHQACIFGFHVEGQVSSGVDRRRRLEAQPIANPRIYGFLGKEIKEVNAGTKEQILRVLVSAVDIVGDHREEVLVQMADGSLRAYFNVATPFVQKPTKLEDPHYRRFLGHATFPSHVAALGTTCSNTEPLSKKAPPPRRDWEGSTRDVAALKERRRPLELHANSRENSADSRDRGRAALKSLDQEITVAELRVAVRRMINACESPGCWRRADRDTNRHGETQADKARRKDPNAVDPTHGPDPTIAERRQPVRDSRCDRRVGPDRADTVAAPGKAPRVSIGGRCYQNRKSLIGKQLFFLDRYNADNPAKPHNVELVQSLWIQPSKGRSGRRRATNASSFS